MCAQLPNRQGGELEVTCLIASEVNAPADAKPLVWRLLTNRVALMLQDAVGSSIGTAPGGKLSFFLGTPRGLLGRALATSDTERLQTALALYMVIAWRINRLMRLGRTLPDLPADLLFEPDEWRAAFLLNKKPVPRQTPRSTPWCA